MILIFFLSAILRKQLDNFANLEFNLIGATALGEIAFIIFIYVTHSLKWGFLAGLIALIIGGFVGARIFGGGEGGFE
jgi:hypothetical protein